MLSTKTELYQAPSLQQRQVFWDNNGTLTVLVVENKGSANSIAIVVQESDDGSTYSDLSGTSKSIAPGKSETLVIISTKRKLALAAQGNESMLVSVQRTINGTVKDLGTA